MFQAGKISDIYSEAAGKRVVFSFEFFPPKTPDGEKVLYTTIRELRDLHPDFVSVTYGAGGSTQARTREWVTGIQNDSGIIAMAHFTCVGASRPEILESLRTLKNAGIRNIMALRGDPPKGETSFVPPVDGLRYANELISFIQASGLDLCTGGACYPEVHPEASSPEADLEHLKKKVEAGASFLVTQLFFENQVYFDFVKKCRGSGITVPIVPGIMPITQLQQIERFTQMAGCKIPPGLVNDIRAHADDAAAIRRISIEFAVKQCRELIDGGAPGLHFYTLNQSHATMEIMRALKGG